MNAVILTTVLSAGNSGLYASSRTLFDLATEGRAPKCFTKLTKQGVPIYCVLLTALIGGLAFLSSLFGNGRFIDHGRAVGMRSLTILCRCGVSMVDFDFGCRRPYCLVKYCSLPFPIQTSLCSSGFQGGRSTFQSTAIPIRTHLCFPRMFVCSRWTRLLNLDSHTN
jgi:hypothetical protein